VSPERHLHAVTPPDGAIVHPRTGELVEASVEAMAGVIDELAEELRGAEAEKRSWRSKFFAATDKSEDRAREHELWPKAVALFAEWQIATGRDRTKFAIDRFWISEPYLRPPPKGDGFVICRWAVWGVALCPNSKVLPTGLVETYNDFELVFRSRAHFERYARRGYTHPEARKLYSLREQGIGPDDERIDPNKHFASKRGRGGPK